MFSRIRALVFRPRRRETLFSPPTDGILSAGPHCQLSLSQYPNSVFLTKDMGGRVEQAGKTDMVQVGDAVKSTNLSISDIPVHEQERQENANNEQPSQKEVEEETRKGGEAHEMIDGEDSGAEKSEESEDEDMSEDNGEEEHNSEGSEGQDEISPVEEEGEGEGFANMVGVGEGVDESDDEGMMEKVAVGLLPSQMMSEVKNDEAGLERKLVEISVFSGKQGLPLWESLSVPMPLQGKMKDELAMDDLKRERRFAELATGAVHIGLERLRRDKVKFRRPGDYFAEMVKGDTHMGRVKGKLLKEKEKIEKAEKRRNNRDITKNRKKVRSTQMEREQEKKRKAKEEIEALSRLRKQRLRERAERSGEGIEDEDEFPVDLLEVERLDDGNRFRPDKEFGEGKRNEWRGEGKNTVSRVEKSKGGRQGKGAKGRGGISGEAGGVQKQTKGPRGKKKRLGKTRRKGNAKKKAS